MLAVDAQLDAAVAAAVALSAVDPTRGMWDCSALKTPHGGSVVHAYVVRPQFVYASSGKAWRCCVWGNHN